MDEWQIHSSFLSQFQLAPVLPMTCKDLVTEGGALHCIAMTQPK
jgi:agmatine/peptidylarginine deiminase